MRQKLPWNHPDTIRRFWSRVQPDPGSDCLLFQGYQDRGWGRLKVWGFPGCPAGFVWAHRYAYALEHGAPEPEDDVHHNHEICFHRNCVNVAHLCAVDHSDHGGISLGHRRDGESDAWNPSEIHHDSVL